MKKKYDIVIIGSGLGGLVSANILAKNGYNVCVLEKNKQFGGNLQTFVRDKKIFDTGVHYLGALDKGQNLYQYFKYLGIMDDLKLKMLDTNKYDVISFDDSEDEFYHAQGYKNFSESLIKKFPDEESAIKNYCNKIQAVCNKFPLYNLDGNTIYNSDNLNLKLTDYLDSITDNQLLKSVLLGSNFLYAGTENTPFYIHALSVNSYILSAWRCVGGGSQISKLLIKKLKESEGDAFRNKEVVKFKFKEENLIGITLKNGENVNADIFISNIEPKTVVKMLDGKGFRKSYINRINKAKSIISAFSVYLVFKPKTFKYINHNYYHFKKYTGVTSAQNYTQISWPEMYMVSMNASKNQDKWAESLTAMTYMKFDEVKQWEDTFNTVSNVNDRGEAYKKFKMQKAEFLINQLEKKFPNIRSCIQSIHISTPLSYRDYIGSNQGAMYGYVKNADNPLEAIFSPKTRIENLFLTGQSLNMHGILGVTISGVLTCSQIIGKEKLLKSINEAVK